jgi:3-oxoacyl-[acyl-carrier-protein] synthase-3
MGVKILSTGSYFPERILTNNDLEKMVDTTDEWITTRTGIKERRIADDKTSTSTLAIKATQNALKETKIDLKDIDLIIVATATPDMLFPSTACFVQNGLGITNCTCFDIYAACSGFIYGLSCARNLIETGEFKTAIVVGAETLSKITNWNDRNTCVLFGDGAGSIILQYSETENSILSIYLGADGRYGNLLMMPAGGSKYPATRETIEKKMHYIHMEGKEVFKLAVVKMVESVIKALEICNKNIDDITLLIPHQANIRIIDTMAEKLNFPREKIFVNLHKYGNISAASTIAALDEARKQGRIKPGDLVEIVAFGSGFTWGAAVIKI